MSEYKPNETAFLESVTATYVTSESPQDCLIKSLAVRTVAPFLDQSMRGLELGCSDGFMTALLASKLSQLTVVDGSPTFIEKARARAAGLPVEFVLSLFEDYVPTTKYDCIFATYVLEHVHDPVVFLRNAAQWLTKDGIFYLVVPNARAMSRQLARHMGLINSLYDLTPNDLNHGHRRVYDLASFNCDLNAAGLQRITQGGLLFKPFADFQMDRLIESSIVGESQMEGLYQLGLEYPEFAGSLFALCRLA